MQEERKQEERREKTRREKRENYLLPFTSYLLPIT
jgi:hypothetical protein